MGDAPERGQVVPIDIPEDTVLCNGSRDVGYYRAARVFGHSSVEWPGARPKPPLSGVVIFSKPLTTSCTCWEGEILRVGRYGTWTKGVLSHQAYSATSKALEQLS
jgi:hypothetical protein